MKILFHDKIKSYLFVLIFGLAMGVMAGLTANLPGEDLWCFGYLGTAAYGFWMCSTSIIVLASDKRKTAVINTALYIISMFFVTAIFRSANSYLISYATREAPYSLFYHLFRPELDTLKWYLGYIFEGESILAIIASPILYFGRKDNLPGKILRILPLCYIVFEFAVFVIRIFSTHQMLDPAILDLLCAVVYILFIKNSFTKKVKKGEKSNDNT